MGWFSRKKKKQESPAPTAESSVVYATIDSCGVFYCDYARNEDVPGDSPVQVNLDEAVAKMHWLTPTDGAFIGFVLPNGITVQFIVEANSDWTLDIPDMARGGSYSKRMNLLAAEQLLREVFAGADPTKMEGVVFDEF